jgi:hypothetical protein
MDAPSNGENGHGDNPHTELHPVAWQADYALDSSLGVRGIDKIAKGLLRARVRRRNGK